MENEILQGQGVVQRIGKVERSGGGSRRRNVPGCGVNEVRAAGTKGRSTRGGLREGLMPLCSVTTGASGTTGASFASATDASTSSAYKFVGRDVGELISNKCVTSLLLGDRGYSYDGRSGVEKVFGLPVGCRVYVTVGVKEEGNATGVHTAHGCFKEAVKGEYFKSMYKGTDGRVEDSVRQIVNGQKGTDGRQGTNADVFSGRYARDRMHDNAETSEPSRVRLCPPM